MRWGTSGAVQLPFDNRRVRPTATGSGLVDRWSFGAALRSHKGFPQLIVHNTAEWLFVRADTSPRIHLEQ